MMEEPTWRRATSGVVFRLSTQNASKIRRKVGNESINGEHSVFTLGSQVPSALLYILCSLLCAVYRMKVK